MVAAEETLKRQLLCPQSTPQQSADSSSIDAHNTFHAAKYPSDPSAFCFLHNYYIVAKQNSREKCQDLVGSIDAIPLGVSSKCLRIDY